MEATEPNLKRKPWNGVPNATLTHAAGTYARNADYQFGRAQFREAQGRERRGRPV
jgi:hypothetical protein